MACSGPIVAPTIPLGPIARDEALVEICRDHFEHRPPAALGAFALHVLGLEEADRSAVFALIPREGEAQWFIARWGRTGVGPTQFMPIPAQFEDDRPGIDVYGQKSTDFTFRHFQWEIVKTIKPGTFELANLRGEALVTPEHSQHLWALLDGRPVADVDAESVEDLAALGISKEEDSDEAYTIRWSGRVWRRSLRSKTLEVMAFDLNTEGLQASLDEVWGDIGGQEEAKRELIRAIQWPVLYPELFRLFKRRRSRGVLLYGPPGTGKTLLGKAVVKLLAALYNRKADDGGFQYVKGHQLLDQYVGNSEKAVKVLFDRARKWKEERGYPSVLFFDEADALFKRRSGAEQNAFTLVPALLAEMDGMDDSGAFVILATNRPDSLDLAVTRPGRIDRKIRVTRPDEAGSARIFAIHLDGVFLEEGCSLQALSSAAARELFSPEHALYELLFDYGESERFCLYHLASGALIQNLVDRATANKMEQCIASGTTEGLSIADIRGAIEDLLAEQRLLRHPEEIAEREELLGRKVVEVRRV